MSLMEKLQYLIDLCISMQRTLNKIVDILGNQISIGDILIDSQKNNNVMMLEVKSLMSTVLQEMNQVIDMLQRLSEIGKIISWSLISLSALLVLWIIFENRKTILNFILRSKQDD